ncbi:unnamed protein product [Phytomonas sp. Hart1]|nr:unnamed protein product [Phytomonas sp. Hart1]|eukprot:CCW69230.1 unnamed protein product [Phytomonas sp. isolate Hart1]
MNSNQNAWEDLRSEARQIDKVLDQQLQALESLTELVKDNTQIADLPSSGKIESGEFSHKPQGISTRQEGKLRDPILNLAINTRPTVGQLQQRFNELSNEVENGLHHLERILMMMEGKSSGNLHFSKHTERFQSMLNEKRRSLQHLINDFRRRKERQELLSGLTERTAPYEEESGIQLLIKEQSAIRHTAAHVDEIVSQTAATQIRLHAQRETFVNIGGKLLQIAERVPIIKSLLSRINSRRRREVVVLSSLITFLFIIVLFL